MDKELITLLGVVVLEPVVVIAVAPEIVKEDFILQTAIHPMAVRLMDIIHPMVT